MTQTQTSTPDTPWVPEELKSLALGILEQWINLANQLNPLPDSPRAALTHKAIQVEITDLPVVVTLLFYPDKILLSHAFETSPDTRIRLDVHTLFELARQRGKTPANVKMEIQGDIDAGQQFKALMDQYEIDWEEQLSKLTGDVIANTLGRGVRRLQHWFSSSFEGFSQSAADYVLEEKQLVSHPLDLADFIQQVDQTRAHLDRLQARVNRLKTNLKKSDT